MQYSYLRLRRLIGSATLVSGLLTGFVPAASAQWVKQDANFPNVSTGVGDIEVVSNSAVWATGYDGRPGGTGGVAYNAFTRTTDGGATWTPGSIAAAPNLAYANISALSGTRAWAAVIDGTVGGGQIYKTVNGGMSWYRQLATGFPAAAGGHLDAIRMFSMNSGVVLGNPLTTTNEFEIYTTTDGGINWTPVPAASLPNPLSGEDGSPGLMVTQGTTNAWFGTNKGRIYHSVDGGVSWTVATTGLTSVSRMAFTSATDGLAMELDATGAVVNLAHTTNGGATWSIITPTGTVYTSDLAPVPGTLSTYLSAGARTGASGSSVSTDGGLTWTDLETGPSRTAIGAADATHVWAGNFTDATSVGGIFFGDLTPAPLGSSGLADALAATVSVFPNPSTSGVFTLHTSVGEPASGATFTVFDAVGRAVAAGELRGAEMPLDLCAQRAGVYALRLTWADGRTATKRLVRW